MANILLTPNYICMGQGALEHSKNHMKKLGRKALIVTDGSMVKLNNVKRLTDVLDEIEVAYEVYSEVNCEPTNGMVEAGLDLYRTAGCDFLVGLGGGSPLDTMKAIGAVLGNGGDICSYVGKPLTRPMPPTVSIPTTAGTGTEASKASVITNTKTNVKMLLNDPLLMSDMAIVDPEFTVTAPPSVTAATGIDALTHAIEAYISKKAFLMTDTYAVSAIKRIFSNLYEVYVNGQNIHARNQMAVASLEAGISFTNSSVTLVHGMSRPIGALFHVPHGLSNAMLLCKCLEFVLPNIVDRLSNLSKEIGVYQVGMNELEAANAFVEETKKLCSQLNIQTLAEYGVNKKEFFASIDKMATDALASGSPGNSRVPPTKEDIIKIYESLWDE